MNKADIKRCTCMCLTVLALFATTVQAGGRRSSSDLLATTPLASRTPLTSRTAITAASLPTCDVNAITPTGPALVFNNPALLTANGFGFRAALQKIIDTSNGTAATSPADLLSSMLGSYLATERNNLDANLRVPVDKRPGEAEMNPSLLVDRMIPVAVFNRFDLTPTDGSICGEHRIVYAMTPTAGLPGGRFFIILEAAYPNPSPSQGLAGCIPVASFWAGLAKADISDATRVGNLRNFFFNGITQDGINLPPVINFNHYRGPLGQVRTNNFINNIRWQLREFRTGISRFGTVQFAVDTVKSNPRAEFYKLTSTDSLADSLGQTQKFLGQTEKFNSLRTAFRTDFLAKQISALTAPELAGKTDSISIVNGIGLNIQNRFNEFQSVSQGASDQPSALIDATLSSNIRSNIQDNPVLKARNLTDVHIVNRAGAATCGGCHLFSRDTPISPTLKWPLDAGFVHVTETGVLSPALRGFFLPAREKVLEDFVCNPPQPPVVTTPPPVITFFSPTSGAVGTLFTIMGANFCVAQCNQFATNTETKLTLNGAPITPSIVFPGAIQFTIPVGATTGVFSVTTPAGSVTGSQMFTVTTPIVTTPPPVITSFSPASGAVGTLVTIMGANFCVAQCNQFATNTETKLTLDGAPIIPSIVFPGAIMFTIPFDTMTGVFSVTTPAGSVTGSQMFTVTP